MIDQLDIRFAKRLQERIVEDLQAAHKNFADGKPFIREDAAATGMNCAKLIGHIEGLKATLVHIGQVHDDLTGKPKKDRE